MTAFVLSKSTLALFNHLATTDSIWRHWFLSSTKELKITSFMENLQIRTGAA